MHAGAVGVELAPAVVQGWVEIDGEPLRAYSDGRPIVLRTLTVFEHVGKEILERHRSTECLRFEVADGKGRIAVDGAEARLLSATGFGGRAPAAVIERAGDVFARPETPKTYVEQVLGPGDSVTVVADWVAEGRLEGSIWVVVGEPRLGATTELHTLLYGLLTILAGGGITAASVLSLERWIW